MACSLDTEVEPGGARGSRPRVVFIAGTSWSGSTLVEQAMAQLDGFVSLGETFWIWDQHWEHMVCECGREFGTCPFWQAVLLEAYGSSVDRVRAEVRARSQGLWRHSALAAMARSRHKAHPRRALTEIGDLVAPIYAAARRITGATTIVDASKAGLWGLTLAGSTTVDLRVVHLVRDPDEFVASDGRRRALPYPRGATRPPRPPWRALVTWLLLHGEADLLTRSTESTLLLYADVVDDPGPALARTLDRVRIPADAGQPFDSSQLVVGQVGHAIGGNPSRPSRGRTAVANPTTVDRPADVRVGLAHPLAVLARRRYRRYVLRGPRR